jgi:hypothetical protein
MENSTLAGLYKAITEDFRGAWNSIADNPDPSIGRGNFMFAHQAMTLLEFVARFYHCNNTLHRFYSNELYKVRPKYFTSLPGPVADYRDFELPHLGEKCILLWALFDLIRNGLAHQYQQILLKLNDGSHFYCVLSGVTYKRYLSEVETSRSLYHLGYEKVGNDLRMHVDPGALFVDFDTAIINSSLLKNESSFQYLFRPKPSRGVQYYNFDSESLEKSLDAGGHKLR